MNISFEIDMEGVSLDFFIGNTIKEIQYEDIKYVSFPEDMQTYLQVKEQYRKRRKEKGPYYEIDLLIGLNQYRDKIFTVEQIKKLISICKGITDKYNNNIPNENKIRKFAHSLIALCEDALLQNKLIIVVGD